MEKILIAGGNGFVGENIQKRLFEEYNLVILDKFEPKRVLEDNVHFYQTDLSSENELKQIIEKERPDFVINLISIVTAERNMKLFDDMIKVNFGNFIRMYEVLKDFDCLKLFIQFGSAEEYGDIISPYSEKDRESPMSPYALVKQLTTNTAIMLNRNYNFPVCIIRPGNLFGSGQGLNKFIPFVISKLKNDEVLEVSPCEQKRDFIHINDFIFALGKVLEYSDRSKGEILNISSGQSVSLKEIVLFIKQELQSKSEIVWGAFPYRENEMMEFLVDISRLEKITNQKYDFDIYERIRQEIGK